MTARNEAVTNAAIPRLLPGSEFMLVSDEDSCKEVQPLMLGEFDYGLLHTPFHLVYSSAFGFTCFKFIPTFSFVDIMTCYMD